MQKIKEKTKEIFKDKYNVCFGVILIIAILSRILFLEQFPAGIDQDEAGMMYDAYCMAEYGTDRYLIEENNLFRIEESKKDVEELEEAGFEKEEYNNFLIYTYQDN